MGTIAKALQLLTHFSTDLPEIGLSQFVQLTGEDKATLHRRLGELKASGFLDQDASSRAYRLGPAISRLEIVLRARKIKHSPKTPKPKII